MKLSNLLMKIQRKRDIELDGYCLQLEAWEKEIKEREKMVIAGKVKPGNVTDEDWGNFVNLRGALMSMPIHDYPALYDAIYKSNSLEQMREQELPEEVKIGFTSMMIVGMENCFRLLRDMKESGQIILTDVIDEGTYRKVTLNADGTVASITSVKREEIPLAINNAEGKTDGLNGAGIEGASDL